MKFQEGSVFSSIGLNNTSIDAAIFGKLGTKILATGGVGEIDRQIVHGRFKEKYVVSDWQAEMALQSSEKISNTINSWLLSHIETRELARILETSLHHGYNHFRRVEKFFKFEFSNAPEMRVNPIFLSFAPSMYQAIRNHDLVEVYTGIKEHHDGAGALFAFGMLDTVLDVVNEAIIELNGDTLISHEEWNKQRWATAFICLHHSKPEKMPSVDEIMKKDGVLFDPVFLLNEAEAMAKHAHMTIEELFPPYRMIRSVLDQIRSHTIEPHRFTRQEVEAIQKATYSMAIADKLDSNFPPELSAARTFLVRPDRPLYIRDATLLSLSVEEEYAFRVTNGGGHESMDDLSRFLFEIQRKGFFAMLPGNVSFLYTRGVFEKGTYMLSALPKIFFGNFSDFTAAYSEIKKSTLLALLKKAKVSDHNIATVSGTRDESWLVEQSEKLLRQRGINGNELIARIFDSIQQEQSEVLIALQKKYEKLLELDVTQFELERIKKMLTMGVFEQQKLLSAQVGPSDAKIRPPWWEDGYYFLPMQDYLITP